MHMISLAKALELLGTSVHTEHMVGRECGGKVEYTIKIKRSRVWILSEAGLLLLLSFSALFLQWSVLYQISLCEGKVKHLLKDISYWKSYCWATLSPSLTLFPHCPAANFTHAYFHETHVQFALLDKILSLIKRHFWFRSVLPSLCHCLATKHLALLPGAKLAQ